jgi:hypothetical protein
LCRILQSNHYLWMNWFGLFHHCNRSSKVNNQQKFGNSLIEINKALTRDWFEELSVMDIEKCIVSLKILGQIWVRCKSKVQ